MEETIHRPFFGNCCRFRGSGEDQTSKFHLYAPQQLFWAEVFLIKIRVSTAPNWNAKASNGKLQKSMGVGGEYGHSLHTYCIPHGTWYLPSLQGIRAQPPPLGWSWTIARCKHEGGSVTRRRGYVQTQYWYINMYICMDICICLFKNMYTICIYLFFWIICYIWYDKQYLTYICMYTCTLHMFPIPGKWETSYISLASSASSPFHHLLHKKRGDMTMVGWHGGAPENLEYISHA